MDNFLQEEKSLLKLKRRIFREINEFTIDEVYESNPCIERDLHRIKFRQLEYHGFVNDFIRKYTRILDCEKSYELVAKWINEMNELIQKVDLHAKQIRDRKEDIDSCKTTSVIEVDNKSAMHHVGDVVTPEFAVLYQPSDGDHSTHNHVILHQPSEDDHVTADHMVLGVMHQPSDGDHVNTGYAVHVQSSDSRYGLI